MASFKKNGVDKQQSTEDTLRAQVEDLKARLEASEARFDKLAAQTVERKGKDVSLAELRDTLPALVNSEDFTKAAPAPAHRNRRRHIAVCTQCYENRRHCDIGEPCKQCWRRGVRCVRSKCEHWKRGTCKRIRCSRWHEGDGEYTQLEHSDRILRGTSRKARMPRQDKNNPRNYNAPA